jgi:xylulokinase
MMQQQLILTIDIGTSGPKVALFDTKGNCIGYEFEEVKLNLSEGGGAEQSPADWILAIKLCYQKLLAHTHSNPKDIIVINCTTQWCGTIPIDKNGKPLMDCIIWMDSRGAAQIKKLVGGFPEVDGYAVHKILKWIQLTGGGPSKAGKDSIAHILWLKENRPDIYEKTWKFLEPKDYINYWLTGIVAASYESITVHWVTDNRDINNIKYSDALLNACGIEREKLPDLVPANSILGNIRKEIADEFGLNPGIPVISGTPDLHSAAVGSGAVRDFEAHTYIGTSSWLVCHLPFKKTDLFHNMATIPSALPGRYLLANEQETSGACLNFIKNNLFFPKDGLNQNDAPKDFYKIADSMVENVAAGSEGIIFLPWLYGERSPVDDHHARGGFYNLSLSSTRAQMIRAVFEGVAMNLNWLLIYAEKMAERKFEHVNFIGGGAHSDIWSQIVADILNRPVRQMKEPLMANSRGTAMLALLSLNLIDIEGVANAIKVNKEFLPNNANRGLYDERFRIFTEIYNKNKSIFAKLNN